MIPIEGDAIGRRENEIAGVGIGYVDKYAVVGERDGDIVGLDIDGRGEGVAVGVDVRHLAEEGVEGLLAVREARRDVETGLWDGEVLVDVDRGISPLVPDLSSRGPCSGDSAAEDRNGSLGIGLVGG